MLRQRAGPWRRSRNRSELPCEGGFIRSLLKYRPPAESLLIRRCPSGSSPEKALEQVTHAEECRPPLQVALIELAAVERHEALNVALLRL